MNLKKHGMEINPKVIEILKEFKILPDDGLGYLLAVYYGHRPTYIPEGIRLRVNATKIVEHNPAEGYKWNIPLYKGAEVAFDWVKTEFIILFSEVNSTRGGKVKETTSRMKKFFANNPHRRKDEVIAATKMYLLNTDSKYIKFPHYFIEKGSGAVKESTLEDWLEKYDISLTAVEGRSSVQNTMQ